MLYPLSYGGKKSTIYILLNLPDFIKRSLNDIVSYHNSTLEIIVKMNFSTPKNLEFSYSKMNLYKECPLKYKFRYIDKIPEKPKPYFAFGHSIHAALEFLYKVKSPPFPTLQEVLKKFEKDWKSTDYVQKGYLQQQWEERDFKKGLDILAKYYEKHKTTLKVPLSTEFRTRLAIDGLNVTAIVDRVDYLGDGKIAIVDYKTGKTLTNNIEQLYMYQKIVENTPSIKELITEKHGEFVTKLEVVKLTFSHINTLTEKDNDRADAKQIKSFWQEVLAVADNIRAKKFEAKPSERTCRWCDYKMNCPAFNSDLKNIRQETEIVCDEMPCANPTKETTLDTKINKYAEFQNKLSKLTEEISAVKQEIIFLMKEKKINKHFTKKYEFDLTKNTQSKILDKNGLVALLKKLGLFEKILTPTKSGVEKLLKDETIKDEDKNQIKNFLSEEEIFTVECKKIDS